MLALTDIFPAETPVNAGLTLAAQMLVPVSDSPRLDAELLMAYALEINRSELLLRQRELAVPARFAGLIERRIRHEPVAYITGRQGFWDLELAVTPDVLIPRADSETLIEAAIAGFSRRPAPAAILDLGTGSGALLLAALSCFRSAQGIGVDASIAALAIATENAATLGFADRAQFFPLDWRIAGWDQALDRRFDLILCNPPYVEAAAVLAPMVAEYEPQSALFAGPDGLDDYRLIVPKIGSLLAADGLAVF
jgi:release factor glutamine methyltransferase